MNHVLLTDRELAAVVRALEEPNHRMTDAWRRALQAKFRAARSATRRVKPPRPVSNVAAVFNDEHECVSLVINPGTVRVLPGWSAVMGTWVPNDPESK